MRFYGIRAVLCALLVAVIPHPAQACEEYGGCWAVPSLEVSQTIVRQALDREIFDRQILGNANGDDSGEEKVPSTTQPRAVPVAPASAAAVLRFVPNIEVRQRNLAQFVARTREQSPENANQMAALFASTDVFALFSQVLAPKGLRVDNVADAYTVYWITAWEASRGTIGDTSRAQAQAVTAQVTAALLETPQLINATSAQKQELAEALLVQTALISASMEAATGDPAQLERIAGAVRQGARRMGLDLDALTLTPKGFVPAQ
jgi:hypothetical protein